MTGADRYLSGLEAAGARFGLERIEALCAELGDPQLRFASVHVVGTNGKSSVARMIEALLEAHGVRAGSYLSPHLRSWRERVRIGGRPLAADELERAVGEVAAAIGRLESGERGGGPGGPGHGPSLPEGERVTQFEAATAAAFQALAVAGVEVAAIEAGLGGRLDATNVIDSEVTVLTSIGLEHTEWLGRDEESIAAEKLAVLGRGSTLVLGDVSPPVQRLARATAAEQDAALLEPEELPAAVVPGGFRRRNLGTAVTATRRLLAARGRDFELGAGELGELAGRVPTPGRLEVVPGEAGAILDVAHNAAGAAALAEALGELAAGERLVGCLALLADKDAAGIAGELAPRLAKAVCTELDPAELRRSGRPGAEPMPAEELAGALAAAGVEVEVAGDPAQALRRARGMALEAGLRILVTGSHHLVMIARSYWLCDDYGNG